MWGSVQTHDDVASCLAFFWALIKAIDKAEAVAKSLLVDESRQRDSVWAWLK